MIKKLISIFVVFCVFIFMVLLSPAFIGDKLYALGTAASTVFTNTATISWTGGNSSNQVAVTVATCYGATWIGEDNKSVVAGNTVSNDTWFTNDGNASATYVLAYSTVDDKSSQAWTISFSNASDGGSAGTSLSLANISAGGAKHVIFYVSVPTSETNGAYMTFLCEASNTNAINANATYYQGYNGTNYGGNLGRHGASAGYVRLYNSSALTNWTVTVQAAIMELVKTVSFTNPAPYGGVSNPVPGALITYKLAYTNSGSATANSVKISDPILTTYVAYSNGTLKAGGYGDDYAAASTTLSDGLNDDAGAYTSDTVYFYPNGTATNSAGNVNSGASGSYFYRVILK